MARLILILAVLTIAYLWFKKSTHRAAMTPTDARALLGLPPQADVDQIRDAHRRLIAKVHPDNGGSAELASRVNLARDTLIGELRKT